MSEQNTSQDDVKVVIEDSQEPTQAVETGATGEDTPSNDVAPSALQSGDQTERASQIISKLGEEKKAAYAQLVTLARSSEVAKGQVKEMLDTDPALEQYVKTKFGPDYDFIVSDKASSVNDSIDLDKIREEERIKAKAEVIQDQLLNNRNQLVAQKAKQLGLNTNEFDKFQKYFDTLRATEGDEAALASAAMIVNADKAAAQTASVPQVNMGGGDAVAPKAREVKISPAMKFAVESGLGGNINEYAKGIDRVRQLSKEEGGESITVLQGI